MKTNVKYRPQGEQLSRFGLSTAEFQFIRGPLGSGKTKATVFKIVKLLAEQKLPI
jgi:ABC-type ATPase involved in cell division